MSYKNSPLQDTLLYESFNILIKFSFYSSVKETERVWIWVGGDDLKGVGEGEL